MTSVPALQFLRLGHIKRIRHGHRSYDFCRHGTKDNFVLLLISKLLLDELCLSVLSTTSETVIFPQSLLGYIEVTSISPTALNYYFFIQLKVLKHFVFLFCITAFYLVSFNYFCRLNASTEIAQSIMLI